MSADAAHFVEHPLQYVALAWMAALYTIKIVQLSRMKAPWDTAPLKGSKGRGAMQAYASAFMPWAMESSRRHLGRWIEFWLYHLGVAAALLATFTLPFASGFMTERVEVAFAVAILPAVVLGPVKFVRRIARPEMRIVSTLDDYFSLATMQIFFMTGMAALLTDSTAWRTTYFLVTAALIFYVPFSKISHYVYFFFARFLVGGRYGGRGVVARRS